MSLPKGSISVRDVSMSFRVFHDHPIGIRDRLVGRRRNRPEEFSALTNVNLEVKAGDTVALIGPNGSGKSTLLKCLARILKPTSGEIVSSGQTAALLELGAGFHGDLTGRENVFLNGSILGFSKDQVKEIFDDIVEFSELSDFIDTPVRNYSSGMYVRLGFAVAVNLSPDILLVDEVLAVGDARFQARCFERIRQLQEAGTTIVLVTHDLHAATTICREAVLLDKGRVVETGISHNVVETYKDLVAEGGVRYHPRGWAGEEVKTRGDMVLSDVRLDTGTDKSFVSAGDRFSVTFEAEAIEDVEEPVFGLILRSIEGAYLFDTNTLWREQPTGSFSKGQGTQVRFDMKANLLSGIFLVTVTAASSDGSIPFAWNTDALTFEVRGPKHSSGIALLDAEIHIGAKREMTA